MSGYLIYEKRCENEAVLLQKKISDYKLLSLDDALANPEAMEDFDSIGLLFQKENKAVSSDIRDFIYNVLGNCDLKKLDYMFSLCICEDKPQHALKAIEKLCSKVGCAPSYSEVFSSDELDRIAKEILDGSIKLAKGSIGTHWFLKFSGRY